MFCDEQRRFQHDQNEIDVIIRRLHMLQRQAALYRRSFTMQ